MPRAQLGGMGNKNLKGLTGMEAGWSPPDDTLRVHSLRRRNSTRSLRWVRLSADLLCLSLRPSRVFCGRAGR